MSLFETRQKWNKLNKEERSVDLRIAVLASFTANPLSPYLGIALQQAELPADIWIAPYNQIVQQVLSDEGDTARYHPDVVIAWPRLEEWWSGQPLPLAETAAPRVEQALQVAGACLEARRRWNATLLFVLPAIPEVRPLGAGDACNVSGVFATATAVRQALRSRLASEPGVLLLDLEESVRELGSERAYNPRLETLARIPFTEELYSRAGERMARLIVLSRRAARKVVVVDADNTLWGGVVGEVGAQGLDLADNHAGEAYREFQSYLLELRRSGVLLALVSKNAEEDVWQAFARREMRLKQEHLSAWRIGWEDKARGIQEIARDLNLGTEAFVFIDDSPAEIAAVEAALPQVACIQMPADPSEWRSVVQHAGVLDRLAPTPDDLKRAEQYREEQRRNAERATAPSPESYLANLGVKVRFLSSSDADLARLAQLVAKTNQFNLNCRRRTETELQALCADSRYLVRLVHAADRFGDYGIVGAMIAQIDSDHADLDTFVLSCRALGRSVEDAMMAELFQELGKFGISRLCAAPEEHPRNEPARRFFARLGSNAPGVAAPLAPVAWPQWVERT